MLTDQEFIELLEDINSDELSLRVAAVKNLWRDPTADPRILPYLEELLHDTTPCLLGIPYIFGEIRWLAAKALAAERAALGINQLVRVRVVKPVETSEIIKAEQKARLEGQWGVDGLLKNLAILRDGGYMPMIELELWPLGKPTMMPVLVPSSAQPVLVPA